MSGARGSQGGGLRSAPRVCAAAILATSLLSAQSFVQAYPSQPIKIVVGTSLDAFSRVIAEHLQKVWGQPVVIEPRAGAGGSIAAAAVASAKPDGHTLLFVTPSYTINTVLGLATYDLPRDFEPVALVGTTAYALLVHSGVAAATLADLIAIMKRSGSRLNCASPGIGTAPHLACEMLSNLAGGTVMHIPYRDAVSAMNGIVAGHVQVSFAVAAVARQHAQAGVVRGLAVTTEQRSSFLPELPTMVELGYPRFMLRGWGGYLVPAGTPKDIVQKLNLEIREAVRSPELQRRLNALGTETPPAYAPAEFGAFIKDDIEGWTQLVAAIGVGKLKDRTSR